MIKPSMTYHEREADQQRWLNRMFRKAAVSKIPQPSRVERGAVGSALLVSRSSVPLHLAGALDRARQLKEPASKTLPTPLPPLDARQLAYTAFALSLDWRGTQDMPRNEALRLDSLGLEYGNMPRPGTLQLLRDVQARLERLPPLQPNGDESYLIARLAPARREFPKEVMRALAKHRRLHEKYDPNASMSHAGVKAAASSDVSEIE